MPDCTFCGRPAETVEHVIPKWLQKHFDLYDQQLELWNGTTMPYRQAVVPACRRCNGDRFSPLESRIRKGTASEREYYLWALKISYCLGHRDTTLLLDRANPGAGPLLPPLIADDIGILARHAFGALDSPTFRFSPDPFGSVMLVDGSSDEFLLIDVPRPFRAVAVALPDRRHLIVLLGDRGVIATMYRSKRRLRKSMPVELPGGMTDQTEVALKLFGMLILRSHLEIPRPVSMEKGVLLGARVPRKLPTVYQPREVYQVIARMLRISDNVANEAHSRYARMYAAMNYLRWR
jgi:hypothetical protein